MNITECRPRTAAVSRKNCFQTLLVGATAIFTLAAPVVPADAKNEEKKQQQQQQKEQQRNENQQRKQNQNADKQFRSNNQGVGRNHAQDKQREREANYQSALNQAQEKSRRQAEQANKHDAKARSNDFNQALKQQKRDGRESTWRDYKDRELQRERVNNQADARERQASIKRENERVEALNRANQQTRNRARNSNDYRRSYRPDKRWDYKLSNRERYQTYKKYHNNWNEQRSYLRSNLSRFNELADLNRQQQEQLDRQMRAAYLQYHNNQYNGPYSWNAYSDPQFIDYIQTKNPSLLQSILGFLGLGDGGDYLYSSNWSDERSELTQNIANIHQLALEGRITSAQESALLDQLRPEFMEYRNNNWNGSVGWSQYSDPNFIDYLNRKKPSILMTVRDFLIR